MKMKKNKQKRVIVKKDSRSSSNILDCVYGAAKDLHDIGIMDEETMRKFEILTSSNYRSE